MVRGILEANGIESEVQGEQLFGIWGALPLEEDIYPSVWIDDERLQQKARDIVNDYERKCREGESTETWTCSHCGEVLERQFSTCWKCGADR